MITGRFLSTNDNGNSWIPAPIWVTTGSSRQRVEDMAARGEFTELIDAFPATYREWREPGTAWLGYEHPIIVENPEPSDNIPVAAQLLAGTESERALEQRKALRRAIDDNRLDADVSNIDLRADGARQVLMDEAIAQAETKLNELTATPDAGLDAFDPTFQPLNIGSITTAASLYDQTARVLSTDPTLDAQQRSDLQMLQATYAQVVIDGDDAAEVPKPTDNVRLKLGVVAEGFGTIQCRRFEQDGWWWLEFLVETDRELSTDDYWVAVYSEGTYLTTPRLTEVGDNVYVADRLAVNLAHTPPKQYEYTLCHQHISNQQFDPLVLDANLNERFDLIRWGGNAS